MGQDKDITHGSAAVSEGVDDAVCVSDAKWFVAVVNNRSEKATAERLDKLGIENYLPIQTVVRVWKNGKRAKVDKVVMPAVVFIHCTEQQRREIVTLPYIFRFMTNKAGSVPNSAGKPLAVVSDHEIRQLKFMLGQSDTPVSISSRSYRKGDRVKVIRGSLTGLEGEVIDMNSSQSELTVSLEYFGCAKLMIDTVNLELVHVG